MILDPIHTYKTNKKLFDGEIKNYKKHINFIDNNLDFRQIQLYKNNRLFYTSYPMQTEKAKELTDFILINIKEVFPLMHLLIN